jgi:hypothetical protein
MIPQMYTGRIKNGQFYEPQNLKMIVFQQLTSMAFI